MASSVFPLSLTGIAARTHQRAHQRPQQATHILTLATDAEIFSSPCASRAVHLLAQRRATETETLARPVPPCVTATPSLVVGRGPPFGKPRRGRCEGCCSRGLSMKSGFDFGEMAGVISHWPLLISHCLMVPYALNVGSNQYLDT
jgi:hypothetical protein